MLSEQFSAISNHERQTKRFSIDAFPKKFAEKKQNEQNVIHMKKYKIKLNEEAQCAICF